MGPTVHSLPPELLAHISAEASCYGEPEPDNGLPPPILSPILFSAVCRRWRAVALNHQSLWTHIDIVVNILDLNGKYYSPNIWVARSGGSPIYVHVIQPRLHDDRYYDLEDNEWPKLLHPDPSPDLPPFLSRLVSFLSPLLPQVCSLTTSLSWPFNLTLTTLINCWQTCGTPGQAKILKSGAHSEFVPLNLPESTATTTFFETLWVLHLHNCIMPWPDVVFGNLVELEIEMGEEIGWVMKLTELEAILISCPRLQTLSLDQIAFDPFSAPYPKPTLLVDLQDLSIAGFIYNGERDLTGMFEAVLAMIQPGQHEMDVYFSPAHVKPSQQVIDAICSFVDRSNVTVLRLQGCPVPFREKTSPYFASQLGPLPRVKTLILVDWALCDTVEYVELPSKHKTDVYQNVCPVNPAVILWPDVQDLFIRHCFLEREHIRELMSAHSIQTLRMRNCMEGPMTYWSFDKEMPAYKDYEKVLSQIVPNVIYHSKNDWEWYLALP